MTLPHWKIVTDSSIQEQNGYNQDLTFELVSPVLKGTSGLHSLRTMITNVRIIGISTNDSCGFHVHVDATPNRSCTIGNLRALLRGVARCFVLLENAFDLLVAYSYRNGNHGGDGGTNAANDNRRTNANRYCQSNALLFGQQSNKQRWNALKQTTSKRQLVHLVNKPSCDRYYKLNMTNLIKNSRPSTVEFRHHGGVDDIQEAECWVRLLLLFCHNIPIKTDKFRNCLLHQDATVQDELVALWNLIGCTGLEQFFMVDRGLYYGSNSGSNNGSSNRLENQWKCSKCGRIFGCSRSLSQHMNQSYCRYS